LTSFFKAARDRSLTVISTLARKHRHGTIPPLVERTRGWRTPLIAETPMTSRRRSQERGGFEKLVKK